jgi:hypothetical protein
MPTASHFRVALSLLDFILGRLSGDAVGEH